MGRHRRRDPGDTGRLADSLKQSIDVCQEECQQGQHELVEKVQTCSQIQCRITGCPDPIVQVHEPVDGFYGLFVGRIRFRAQLAYLCLKFIEGLPLGCGDDCAQSNLIADELDAGRNPAHTDEKYPKPLGPSGSD